MQIIPVVDIRHGVVVQAVAGNRGEYRPVKSCLTDSVQPLNVVHAIQQATGCRRIYVFDLNGSLDQYSNLVALRQTVCREVELLLEAAAVGRVCRIVLASEKWTA